MSVYIQKNQINLEFTPDFRPSPFSFFLATLLRVDHDESIAIDAGAGCGILAIVLAKLGADRVYAIEHDNAACSLIRSNANLNGVEDQVIVVEGEMEEFNPPSPVDIIVANPPTMPSLSCVPPFAMGGGIDGDGFLLRLLDSGRDWLGHRGRMMTVVSTLLPMDFASACSSAGFHAQPVSTTVLPFRDYYYDCYSEQQLAEFAAARRVVRSRVVQDRVVRDEGMNGWRYDELLYVYDCLLP